MKPSSSDTEVSKTHPELYMMRVDGYKKLLVSLQLQNNPLAQSVNHANSSIMFWGSFHSKDLLI